MATVLKPPINNVFVPTPSTLARAHNRQVSNQVSLRAAKRGEPESYVFGRCIAQGKIVAADNAGANLVIDVHWSVGEIEEFEHRIFDGIAEGLGTALGENEHFTGTAGQAASTIMSNLKGSYDAQADKAHSVLTMRQGWNLGVKMLMKGIKLVDPRNSPQTPIYSTNPALALARVLVDCSYQMDWASVATCANYCDELVGSPQFKRWEIGGQVYLTRHGQLATWLQTMSAYANCFIDVQGSTVALVPDTPRASNHTITADSMIGSSVRLTTPGGRDEAESVTVRFNLLQEPTPPIVQGNDRVSIKPLQITHGTAGAAGTHSSLPMPFFQDFQRAGRKADQEYNKSRMRRLIFDTFDAGLLRTAGDRGSITNAAIGLSSADFSLVNTPQLISPGRWRCEYAEYSTANYSDVYYDGTYNDTELQNPSDVPDGPTPSLSEELYTGTDGVTYARIRISFTGIEWAYADNYQVDATGGGETVANHTVEYDGIVTHVTYTTSPLVSGTTYTVNISVRSTNGTLGDPGTAQLTSVNGTDALLDEGDLTNMHVYILDGDSKYATSSQKLGSPGVGETFSSRFGTSPEGQAWSAGEIWLGDQVIVTVFETEIWDSGQVWDGLWRFNALNITGLTSATRSPFVSLSDAVSPLSFSDNGGWSFSGQAQYMKAECQVGDSPITAGMGLHVKLPMPVAFDLGQ
jgi:hypothetical protein